MKTTQLFSCAILAVATTLGSIPAHAADGFTGIRLLSQRDTNHTKSVKGALTLDQTSQQLAFNGGHQQSVVVP